MALGSFRVSDLNDVLLMTLLLLATVTIFSVQTLGEEAKCIFPHHKNAPKMDVLKPLMGKTFSVKDENEKFEYIIGICTAASEGIANSMSYQQTGVLQTEIISKKMINIGNYTNAEFRIGTDWAMLEYREGQAYGHHCNGDKRVAVIMITCNPLIHDLEDVDPVVIGEENNKTSECYYLFELSHSCICNYEKMKKTLSVGLSIGSIVVIVFVGLCAVYVLGGVLYNRFVLGAKGLEQIPNYNFWLDFGNLQADGCNLVCRTGQASRNRTYKGIADDQLGEAEDDRDDHLLPM